MSHPSDHSPSKIRDAQAKHQAALFADHQETPAPPATQAATDHTKARAASLKAAADKKRAALGPDEAAQLRHLSERNEQQRQAVRRTARPTPPPAPTTQAPTPRPQSAPAPPSDLEQLSRRNDLASAALQNMRRHARQAKPAPAPTTDAAAPAAASQPSRKAPPSPEELDKLLRAMASRAADRPRPGRGPERMDADPVAETAPELPPEVPEEAPERQAEKQAEIIEKLRAKESAVTGARQPIPQADQQRAVEAVVQASVPIKTEGNAVSSAPLHDAIANLQTAMRAHEPTDTVSGVNTVQSQMPNHPLYTKEQHD